MIKLSRFKRTALLSFVCLASAAASNAQSFDIGVRIENGENIGGGYTIARGSQCFVVTAAHVVHDEDGELASSVKLYDVNGMTRKGTPRKESPSHDLALVEVSDPAGFACNKVWSDGSNARKEAGTSKEVFLQRHNGLGDETRIQLRYEGNDGPTGLKFGAANSRQALAASKGDSGWPVFSMSGELLGISERVDSVTGTLFVLNQTAVNAAFSSDVVSNRAYRILASQVTLRGRSESRSATISMLEVLQASDGIIPIERDPYYIGTSSSSGNVDPRLARRSTAPPIPPADYLLAIDIVLLEAETVEVAAYETSAVSKVAEDVVTRAILKGIFGNAGEEAAEKANRDRSRQYEETKRVMDVTLDVSFTLTDLESGEVMRHRVPGTVRIDQEDRKIAESEALTLAIRQGLPALLRQAGL
jgi:hypothetical protein